MLHSNSDQDSMVLAQDGHVDQWNRNKSPEINTCIYSQLNFDKDVKNIQWVKDSIFNKYFGKTGYPYAKKKKKSYQNPKNYNPYFMPFTKNNQNGSQM